MHGDILHHRGGFVGVPEARSSELGLSGDGGAWLQMREAQAQLAAPDRCECASVIPYPFTPTSYHHAKLSVLGVLRTHAVSKQRSPLLSHLT